MYCLFLSYCFLINLIFGSKLVSRLPFCSIDCYSIDYCLPESYLNHPALSHLQGLCVAMCWQMLICWSVLNLPVLNLPGLNLSGLNSPLQNHYVAQFYDGCCRCCGWPGSGLVR